MLHLTKKSTKVNMATNYLWNVSSSTDTEILNTSKWVKRVVIKKAMCNSLRLEGSFCIHLYRIKWSHRRWYHTRVGHVLLVDLSGYLDNREFGIFDDHNHFSVFRCYKGFKIHFNLEIHYRELLMHAVWPCWQCVVSYVMSNVMYHTGCSALATACTTAMPGS